jgi:hypothetical protein
MFLFLSFMIFFYEIREQEGGTGWEEGFGISRREEVAGKGVGG